MKKITHLPIRFVSYKEKKDKQITVRLCATARERLEELARLHKKSRADIIDDALKALQDVERS